MMDKSKSDSLREFKINLSSVFAVAGQKERVIGVSHRGEMQFLLFVSGLYMDCASHNVVADVYFFEVTPENNERRGPMSKDERLDIKVYDQRLNVLKIWKESMPAMVERCRDWEHKETCEYSKGIEGWMCSCGKGKVSEEFMQVMGWAGFAPMVVRCAVSPLFPAPFIEQTREQQLMRFSQALAQVEQDFAENKTCIYCGRSEGETKKCGACGQVYYCGRDCQRKHWKWHKSECNRKSAIP
jgi:hypothetical protein